MEYQLIFVSSPAQVGDTLVAIETALSQLGYQATGSVYRASSWDEPGGEERISSLSGIRPIADRLNEWDSAGGQWGGDRCPITIDFLVEAEQQRLVVSGSVTFRGICRLYDREGSGDLFFQTLATLASAIRAELGVMIYEIIDIPFPPWEWLANQTSSPFLCCARVSSLDNDQRERLEEQGCRCLEVGEYAVFVDSCFDAVFGSNGV